MKKFLLGVILGGLGVLYAALNLVRIPVFKQAVVDFIEQSIKKLVYGGDSNFGSLYRGPKTTYTRFQYSNPNTKTPKEA